MTVKVSSKANGAWKRFMAQRAVTYVQAPELTRSDRFFLMGS